MSWFLLLYKSQNYSDLFNMKVKPLNVKELTKRQEIEKK